ncbi:hypothetical protein VNI00_017030 [Paramarasmius palmivorus]|uniref:Uncharacterized protein n=1 Tax=Paramarasmius palmivorus TaxID=297713 RepID=A0AAW0B9K3_9AGAR
MWSLFLTALALCITIANTFSIAPLPSTVTVDADLNVTWFRNSTETQGFVLVKGESGESLPSTNGIVYVTAAATQTIGTVQFSFLQTKTFELYAVQTDSDGTTSLTIYTYPKMVVAQASPTSGSPSESQSTGSGMSNTRITNAHSTSTTCTTTTQQSVQSPAETDPSGSTQSASGTSMIIGSTVGGAALITFMVFLIMLVRRRRKHRLSTSTLRSGHFDRERMIVAPIAPAKSEVLYSPIRSPSSISSAPSYTETAVTVETERPRARTDRQMEIEEVILSLEAQMIRLPRTTGRPSPEESAIRAKIARLHMLKMGDWALQRSDEKPLEMV